MSEILYGQFQKETKQVQRVTSSGDVRVTLTGDIRITDALEINYGHSVFYPKATYIPFLARAYSKVNSIWKNAQIFVKANNIWVLPLKGYRKISGIWKRIL